MRIAFLGLGRMGSAIAGLLVKKGYEVAVWNRSEGPRVKLAELGATAAGTPGEAVGGARVVFTMLNDDAALEEVLFAQGALDSMAKGAVHVSMSTISVALAERLETEHAGRGQGYLGCPVFGRPEVAEQGKLWLAVAGTDGLLLEITPVLHVFSRGISVVGERPSQAHALKLGGNFLITAMIASLSEAFVFAEHSGIDQDQFLETVNSALFQSPFYASYGQVMLHPPEIAGATLALGDKDTRLFREAGKEIEMRTPMADIFQQHFNAAMEQGSASEDWAAGYLNLVRLQAKGLDL